IAWTLNDTELHADTIPGTGDKYVIATDGADLTRILGGTGHDTLTVRSGSSADTTATINNNRVEIQSGLVVVTQNDPTKDFDTYRNYDGAMAFDALVAGSTSYKVNGNPAYRENGFALSTSNAAGLGRNDSISPAAVARNDNETFRLV